MYGHARMHAHDHEDFQRLWVGYPSGARGTIPMWATSDRPGRQKMPEDRPVYETEPLPELVAAAERHLATGDHQLTAEQLAEYLPDQPDVSETPVITYMPETPAKPASYICSRCPGRAFYPVDPTYGHPARNAELLRNRPELRETVLGLTPGQAAIVIEDWDRRRATQGQVELEEVLKRKGRATKRAGRPGVQGRIRRCQDYLLEAWERLGTQDAAIWELIALADTDPQRHRDLVGGRYPMAYETYRSYLKAVDPARKAAVRSVMRAA